LGDFGVVGGVKIASIRLADVAGCILVTKRGVIRGSVIIGMFEVVV